MRPWTTGSQIGYHELIEVAAVRASPDGLVAKGEWCAKIFPTFPGRISATARDLNGFSSDTSRGASLSCQSLWGSFAEFVSGAFLYATIRRLTGLSSRSLPQNRSH